MEPRLPGYRLVHHLGEGGMGSVWLARNASEHLVAVKTLKSALADDPRVASLFLREMRLASAIRHPNVVAVSTTGQNDDGAPWFEMEWVEGLTVRSITRIAREQNAPVPIGIALRIAFDACEGLHAAHELRSPSGELLALVHRDVTPHNILVSKNGIAKIIDFGVAKAAQAVTGDTTSSGGVKGKIRYMAPEQALGKANVDRRADIFALGAVLFELVTGKPPIQGDNDVDILRQLVSKASLEIPKDLPAPIAALLERALAKRVDDRFADAQAFARAIADVAAQLGVLVTDPDVASYIGSIEAHDPRRSRVITALAKDAATITQKTRRSPRRAASLVGAAAVAMAALGVAFFGSGSRPASATPEPIALAPTQAAIVATTTTTTAAVAPPREEDAPAVIELPTKPVATTKKARPVAPVAPFAKESKPSDLTTALHSRR